MSQERWAEVERYVTDTLIHPDSALDSALRSSARAGLPKINVSPPEGMFLMLIARMNGARRILEIGTLGGYSTIWLARALLFMAYSRRSRSMPSTQRSRRRTLGGRGCLAS